MGERHRDTLSTNFHSLRWAYHTQGESSTILVLIELVRGTRSHGLVWSTRFKSLVRSLCGRLRHVVIEHRLGTGSVVISSLILSLKSGVLLIHS